MPALCSRLSGTYYAQNYASIIGGFLVVILFEYIYQLILWHVRMSPLKECELFTKNCVQYLVVKPVLETAIQIPALHFRFQLYTSASTTLQILASKHYYLNW